MGTGQASGGALMKRRTGLILALDETNPERALWVAEQVKEYVDAIKVNYPLVLSAGMEVVGELSKLAPVICDFKVADIPNTDRLIVEQVKKRGASGIIVHAFTGSDSMKAAVDAAGDMDVFAVTEMSHPGGKEFTARVADELAKVAVNAGATGIIAPATRPERIRHLRELIGKDMLILSPGVGAQGGSAKDTIDAGADFIIVGRAIYKSEDPGESAKRLVKEIGLI